MTSMPTSSSASTLVASVSTTHIHTHTHSMRTWFPETTGALGLSTTAENNLYYALRDKVLADEQAKKEALLKLRREVKGGGGVVVEEVDEEEKHDSVMGGTFRKVLGRIRAIEK